VDLVVIVEQVQDVPPAWTHLDVLILNPLLDPDPGSGGHVDGVHIGIDTSDAALCRRPKADG
jgi:hypothetical protein